MQPTPHVTTPHYLPNKSNKFESAKTNDIELKCKSVQRNYYFISILVRIEAPFLSGIPYIFSKKLYKVILVKFMIAHTSQYAGVI